MLSSTTSKTAIEKGDWAAVGATAAILANDNMTRYSSDNTLTVETGDTTDAARAAEMDQMVDSGNWDGVVAVAAKYADDASTQSPSVNSQDNSSSNQRGSLADIRSFASNRDVSSIASASVETADASSYSGSGAETRSHNSHTTYSGGTHGGASYSGTETIDEEDDSYTEGDSLATPSVTSSFTTSVTSSYVSRGAVTSSMVSSTSATTSEEEQRMIAYRAEVEALVRRVVPGKNSFLILPRNKLSSTQCVSSTHCALLTNTLFEHFSFTYLIDQMKSTTLMES